MSVEKHLFRAFLILGVLAIFAPACHSTRADEPDPPAQMAPVDAARLDAALAHLRELQAQMAPYQRTAEEILQRYKIDPAQLGKSVAVDFATGKIERAPSPSEPHR